MITLYHNAASTCSQKVRFVLAEKGLDYESREIDLVGGAQHEADYVKLNPNHVVPTLVHGGNVFIESTLINEYLEDAFPNCPLRPEDAGGRHAMRLWTKRIDELHPNAGVLTFSIGTRPMILQRSEEERNALIDQIPDPKRRALRRSVIECGVKAPEFPPALHAFLATLDQMQADLSEREWLAGSCLSLADAAALPYVMRLDHLAMTPFLEERPRIADWYARMRARPSFETAVASLLPPFVIEMFQKNGTAVWSDVESLAYDR
jgi:glutathione S-transferase